MDRIPLLTEILAQNPTDSFARYGLALALSEANRPEEALAQFDQLRTLNPDYVPGYQMAGQFLVRLSRPEEARAYLEQGIDAANRTNNHHALAEMQALIDDLPPA
jgi:tetratricopeptide (TPR) repeat protein